MKVDVSELKTAANAMRVLAEAGSRKGLMEFAAVALTTRYLALDHYGASGPYKVLAEAFGFTVDNAFAFVRELV